MHLPLQAACSSTGAHTHKRKLGHVPLKVSQVPSGETAATSATHRGRIYLLHQSNVKLIDGFERFQINYPGVSFLKRFKKKKIGGVGPQLRVTLRVNSKYLRECFNCRAVTTNTRLSTGDKAVFSVVIVISVAVSGINKYHVFAFRNVQKKKPFLFLCFTNHRWQICQKNEAANDAFLATVPRNLHQVFE